MSEMMRPEALWEREWALETFVRALLDDYREYLNNVYAYEAHLERKVDTLERLVAELAGRPHAPATDIDFDTEIPF